MLPLVLSGVILVCYIGGRVYGRVWDPERMRDFKSQCHRTWIVLLFMMYPSLSATIFKTFLCKDFYGESYLLTDVTIKCNTEEHVNHMLLAFGLVIIYTLGIPFVFLWYLLKMQVPRIVRYNFVSRVVISLMDYLSRKQEMHFERFAEITVIDEVPTTDLQAMHATLCSEAPYTPEYQKVFGKNPTEQQQRRIDMMTEQWALKLQSRNFVITQLCQWALDNNIPISRLNWDELLDMNIDVRSFPALPF